MMGSCDAKVAVMAVDGFSVLGATLLPKLISDKVRVVGTEHFIGRSV